MKTIEQFLSCGECDECHAGIRCRELTDELSFNIDYDTILSDEEWYDRIDQDRVRMLKEEIIRRTRS